MARIKIGGREIPLLFDMVSWAQMDAEVCTLARINEVLGYDRENKTSTSVRDMVSIVRILGNEGLECAEEATDLTDKWLMKNMKPAQFSDVRMAVITAIDEGMATETQGKKGADEPRDLVLEEINKKKQ